MQAHNQLERFQMPLPERNGNQNVETLPARDKSDVELSASSHPNADAQPAGALPDAFARKKLKSKFRNTSGPRQERR